MAAEQPRTPPPDAGGVSRRQLLKAGAGAATVGAVTTRTGPLDELSPIGDADAISLPSVPEIHWQEAVAKVATTSPPMLGYQFAMRLTGYEDALDSAIAADEVQAHQTFVAEMERYNIAITEHQNKLTASTTLAHQDARNAIADAWEAGKSASTALTDAHIEIEDYYAARLEHNWLVVTAFALQQMAYAHQAALGAVIEGGSATRDRNDSAWSGPIISHPTYGDSSWTELIPASNEYGFSLYNGETMSLAMPDIRIIWDSSSNSTGDADVTVSAGDFLAGDLDPATEPTATIDGETATLQYGNWNIPNVTDPDTGESLPGYQVLDIDGDTFQIRSDIRAQADTVVNGFSQTLVDNLYAELDAGNITPNDVRGIDGMAQYLGGTSDAYADSYLMALMQQLGLEKIELDTVAKMTVGYRGLVGHAPEGTGADREIYPKDYVSSASWEGLLFSSNTPDTINSGETYIAGPIVYQAANNYTDGTGGVQAVDAQTGDTLWVYDSYGSNTTNVVVPSPTGEVVYLGQESSGNVAAFDVTTQTVKWEYNGGSSGVAALSPSPDGQYLVVNDGGSITCLDNTGSQVWSNTATSDDFAITPDGSAVLYVNGGVYSANIADGSVNWSNTSYSETLRHIDIYPDGSGIVVSETTNNGLMGLSASDGSVNWTWTGISEDPGTLSVDKNKLAYTNGNSAGDGGPLYAIDSTGSEAWTYNPDTNSYFSVVGSPDGSSIYFMDGGQLVEYDLGTKTILWGNSDADSPIYYNQCVHCNFSPQIRPNLNPSGEFAYNSYFFDAVESTQHGLTGGLVTVESMQDQDGNNVDTTTTEDVGPPDYDSTNMQEYVDYLLKSDEFLSALQDNYDDGSTTTTTSGTDGGWWPPSFWPSFLPDDPLLALILGVAGLAGINAATS